MAKVTRREPPDENLDLAPQWAVQYDELQKQIRFLEDRRNQLKKTLSGLVEEHGYEDDRGSLFLDVDDGVTLKKEKRVTQGFDEDIALDILKEKYPELFDRCTMVVRTVDQDSLLAAYYEEAVGEDDFNRCFPKRISYAFKIVHAEPSQLEEE